MAEIQKVHVYTICEDHEITIPVRTLDGYENLLSYYHQHWIEHSPGGKWLTEHNIQTTLALDNVEWKDSGATIKVSNIKVHAWMDLDTALIYAIMFP